MTAPSPFLSTTFTDGEGVDNTKLFTRVLSWLNSLLSYVLGLSMGFVGETNTGSTVTLSTTSRFAAGASFSFTVPTGGARYKITTTAQIVPSSATSGRYLVQSGYNTGNTVAVGSFVGVGQALAIITNNSLAGGGATGEGAVGTVFLTAGNYTAYPGVTRLSGGAVGDTTNTPYVLVEQIGLV